MSISPQTVIATVASAVACGTAGVALRAEFRQHGSRAINPVSFLWLGVGYFVGLGALAAGHVTHAAEHYSVQVSLLALAAICAGIVGIALGSRETSAITRLADPLPIAPALGKRSLIILACGFITVAVAVRALAFKNQFVFGALRPSLPSTWANYVYDLRHAALPAGLAAFLALGTHPVSRLERVLLWCVILVAVTYSFLQFSRRPLVLLCMGWVVLWIHTSTHQVPRLTKRAVVIATIGVVLFLVALFGAAFRWLTLQVSLTPDWGLMLEVIRRLTVAAFSLDAYDVHLACVQNFRGSDDWLLGNSFLQVISNPIPRALWEGKPESFGFTIAKLMGNYSTNFGPTAFGEGYANFGLVGSALFGWLLGALARTVQIYQAKSRTGFVALMTAMISFEFFPEVRGDLQGITTPMLERIGILALGWYLTAWLGPRVASARGSGERREVS